MNKMLFVESNQLVICHDISIIGNALCTTEVLLSVNVHVETLCAVNINR